ncbi:adenylyl cyclase-associated protein 1-like [Diadema setosum]|uniref:adenylyl cyclase-associated protein 1-like n=1 Tax=Diadema setosum TaxID=31175 RepID=UPI003B3B9C29
MASEALNMVKQLKEASQKLRTVANDVAKTDVTKEFADAMDEILSILNSVNTDLCVGSSAFVQDYDILVTGPVAHFIAVSNQIGGEIAEQAAIFNQAFQAQRAFISLVAECKQPPQDVLQKLLQPTSEKLNEVQQYREARRASKMFNHLSALSEAVPMLGWVTVAPKPAPYVKEMIGSAQFYTNRVLKDYKEKEPIHKEWTTSLVKILQELEKYVRTHHLTGTSWNRQGKDAAGVVPASAPAGPPAGGPPGPPPPPPPVEAPSGPAPKDAASEGRAALFADLNKGTDITSGLKKVTDDMKTHKNPELRKQTKPVSSSPQPFKPRAAPAKPVAAAAPTKKPPRNELVMKKWEVEYFENAHDVKINNPEMKQTVYIYKCQNSTITIPSKVNSITIDGCKKVGVVFESVLGSVDVVNSQSVQIQVTGVTPIVNIDKTDGCMVYLSAACKDAQIISAKSSEMNVLIPDAEGEFTEFPLPEQYRSVYNGKTMVTDCVESLG